MAYLSGAYFEVLLIGTGAVLEGKFTSVSGLDMAIRILKKIDEIGFCYLTNSDVVRHPLVQKIVQAYDDYEAKNPVKEKNIRGKGYRGRSSQ